MFNKKLLLVYVMNLFFNRLVLKSEIEFMYYPD